MKDWQRVADEAAMLATGAALAQRFPSGGLITLHGDLGAGKTTLVRGLLRALGHTGNVKSPTYTLVEPYHLEGRDVFHFDLYRLADAEELEYMGIRDYFPADTLCLVEWPEKGEGWLPAPDLEITLSYANEQREVQIDARTAIGEAILERLSSQCA